MSATADGLADQHHHHSEREIQDDVQNVPVLAFLTTVATLLIIVSVIFLTGVYYLTAGKQQELRQSQADSRITDLEAHRQIDDMVVDGYYKEADVEENGTVTRGKVHVPVEIGMRQIADKY
ncbi:hypothetical protein Poly30_37850 [Planctomycetes bacterium Poly30]|uniref:Uncharacterized protein n=1 Tax=Saltatorellus ferox TaxID=2528018 RepID=A0A518EVY3_9BACT|nr:hypothetical protein Poly30_37850 [Planctomycetes bacterium Poly30]